tara:strand:+ start:808 stop:936 length:129 start_codon:yes stop_codon:yes gene_type:complete
MPKKRKLNSKNPKYQKVEEIKVRKEFAQEVKGVKIYKVYYLT